MPETLHYQRIEAQGDGPERWLVVMHGLFGSGRNWKGIARNIVAERADWGVLLVDLPHHGQSKGSAAVRTIASAALSVNALVLSLGLRCRAILGHSFGGKVALESVLRWAGQFRTAFIVDSVPGRARGIEAEGVIAMIRRMPAVFTNREAAVDRMKSEGLARPVALWMAMNLTPCPGGFRWRFDIDSIEGLYNDFAVLDLWPAVETDMGVEIHFIRATRSQLMTRTIVDRINHAGRWVVVHEADSGHWINAENPEALTRLIVDHLDGTE